MFPRMQQSHADGFDSSSRRDAGAVSRFCKALESFGSIPSPGEALQSGDSLY